MCCKEVLHLYVFSKKIRMLYCLMICKPCHITAVQMHLKCWNISHFVCYFHTLHWAFWTSLSGIVFHHYKFVCTYYSAFLSTGPLNLARAQGLQSSKRIDKVPYGLYPTVRYSDNSSYIHIFFQPLEKKLQQDLKF